MGRQEEMLTERESQRYSGIVKERERERERERREM